ncbi:MAG: leucine-rich repeat protein [Firmicutes bacterium]|nr:leucine-rich repeat protein [Bacillota bacterium]
MDNKRASMTLREICNYLCVDLPKKYESIADEEQTLCFRSKYIKPGDIYMVLRSYEDYNFKKKTSKDQYQEAIDHKAKMIIMGKDVFYDCGLKEEDYPVLLLDEPQKSVASFFSKLSSVHDHVVMITGSIGKTTTKDICATVAERNFNSFANAKNTNTPAQTAKFIYNESLNPREVYIQECGAGYRTTVELASELLKPDIFILTNVLGHHLQIFKTMENIFNEKVSPDNHMKPDGVIITNYDDERIRDHSFKHRVISFAVENDQVDYKANNLVQKADLLSFDIFERESGISTHVKVRLLGKHNAYNVLAAFALGRILGVSREKLAKDLSHYRPEGVRQNIQNVGGVTIDMDCYNVSEESIISMLEAGFGFPLEDGGRRIALLGGENKLGNDMKTRSIAFGKKLRKMHFDKYLLCGTEDTSTAALKHFGDAQDIYEGYSKFLSKKPKKCELLLDMDQMVDSLKRNVKRNDLLMVKGIYYLNMPIAVDKVFGTSYSYSLSHNVSRTTTIQEGIYTVSLIPAMKEVVIKAVDISDGKLIIPDSVSGYPVIRIAPGAFSSREDIKEVQLGNSLKNIGEEAFLECTGLKNLTIPGNVLVIEKDAFSTCSGLEKVKIESGITHIGMGAFRECTALSSVEIPDTVGMIEEDAFDNCDDLTIICSRDSFAHKYAEENSIKVELI